MNYITNFATSRAGRIGSSDVPAIIQHPERQESLKGYDTTPLTVYMEKTGQAERKPAGLHAALGHAMEPYVLYEAIKRIDNEQVAKQFLRGYQLAELDATADGYPTAHACQSTDWLHHTEAMNDHSVSHADCINPERGIIIEAKTASYWAAVRRDTDPYRGYDTSLDGAQGIPLAHYMQVQHQMATYAEVYGITIKRAYLALISDGVYHQWEILPDIPVQERIIELCSYLYQCITTRTPPKRLAISIDDVKLLYPETPEDFRVVSGDAADDAIRYAAASREAAAQVAAWELKKRDADAALAAMLTDAKRLRIIRDGSIVDVAAWQERAASERVAGLSELRKMPDGDALIELLREQGMIKKTEASRFVKVKYKE